MRLLAIALAFVIFAIGGCGDDDDGGTSPGQGPSAADTTGTDENTTDERTAGRTTTEENTTVDEGETDDDRNGAATEQDEPSRAEFIRAADRICMQSRKDLAASGDDLEELVRLVQKGEIDQPEYYRRSGDLTAEFAATASRAIDAIEALPRPGARRAALDAYLKATRTQVRLLEDQAEALRDARPQATTELNLQLARARAATQKAARRFGFHSCGRG